MGWWCWNLTWVTVEGKFTSQVSSNLKVESLTWRVDRVEVGCNDGASRKCLHVHTVSGRLLLVTFLFCKPQHTHGFFVVSCVFSVYYFESPKVIPIWIGSMLTFIILTLKDVSNCCQENEDVVIEPFRKQGYQSLHMLTTAGPDTASWRTSLIGCYQNITMARLRLSASLTTLMIYPRGWA